MKAACDCHHHKWSKVLLNFHIDRDPPFLAPHFWKGFPCLKQNSTFKTDLTLAIRNRVISSFCPEAKSQMDFADSAQTKDSKDFKRKATRKITKKKSSKNQNSFGRFHTSITAIEFCLQLIFEINLDVLTWNYTQTTWRGGGGTDTF